MKIKAETINGDLVEIEPVDLRWRVSAYGVLIENDKILLLKNIHAKDKWFLPGGEVELDEDISEAIKREFVEETGVEVGVESMINYKENFFKGPRDGMFHSLQLFFKVKEIRVIENANLDKYAKDAQWFPLNQLSLLPLSQQINFLLNLHL